jgi:hypothetical protein
VTVEDKPLLGRQADTRRTQKTKGTQSKWRLAYSKPNSLSVVMPEAVFLHDGANQGGKHKHYTRPTTTGIKFTEVKYVPHFLLL